MRSGIEDGAVRLTRARRGDILERRGRAGEVVRVRIVNIFTTTLPGGESVRVADYRQDGDATPHRIFASESEDRDVWTRTGSLPE